MKRRMVSMMALFVLMGSLAFGDDSTLVVIDNKLVRVESVVSPVVTITAPASSVDLGEIVKLEAKVEGEAPSFVKSRKFKWTVTERGYVKQFWEQDNWVIFGTGVKNTTIRVTCEVTLSYLLENEEVFKKVETVVDLNVGTPDPDPTPNPEPDPTPTPEPDPIPDLTGLAKKAHDWAVEVGPAHKARSAPVMAKVLSEISVRIGHDEAFKTPRGILEETKKEMNETLEKSGFTPQDWDPWGAKLQEYAYNEYQAGRMQVIEDYKKAWMEISTGLQQLNQNLGKSTQD